MDLLCIFPEYVSNSSEWKNISKYFYLNELGYGSYGKVCRAADKAARRTVAIKKFISAMQSPYRAKACLRELQIFSHLAHPNIVKIKEIFYKPSDPSVYMVMEDLPFDLRSLIKSSISLTSLRVKQIMYDLLKAVYYVHSAGIMHRDLKPANVLVGTKGEIRLCDFGLSRSYLKIKEPFKSKNEEDDPIPDEGVDEKPIVYHTGYFTVGINAHVRTSMCRIKTMRSEYEHCLYPLKKRPKSTFSYEKRSPLQEFDNTHLTKHVTTRWYRAPEVILLENTYGPPIDVWALGCIFAELLQMLPSNPKNYTFRKPLFPGFCCLPLSPGLKRSRKTQEFISIPPKGDQLRVICEVIGVPDEKDMDFITDLNAKIYIRTLRDTVEEYPLKARFFYVESQAVNLLEKMLEFNPKHRITAKEALEHPYFEEIRDKATEVVAKEAIEEMVENSGNYKDLLSSFLACINKEEGNQQYIIILQSLLNCSLHNWVFAIIVWPHTGVKILRHIAKSMLVSILESQQINDNYIFLKETIFWVLLAHYSS
eukprot:TRINITY_DN1755_c0_g1_i1.p1 TRINITY_DN1755_c0_g1~~TRINITY_DN1755_c0_g1_i1.p1  ORF type:complete len:605 (+),score=19.33 TRINITY_DN1755_c0_g1_i1:209-1816(+)